MPLEARVLLGWIEETQANRYLTRDCDGLTILNRRNDVDRRIIAIFNLIATCRERRLIDGGGLPIVSEIHNGGSCRMLIVNKDSFHRRDLSSVLAASERKNIFGLRLQQQGAAGAPRS